MINATLHSMATIKSDPSEGNTSYQDGSGKFFLLSWHSVFALIALCLKSTLFCIRVATLSHSLAYAQVYLSLATVCSSPSYLYPLWPKARCRDKTSLVLSKSVDDSMIVAHVPHGAPACRPLAAMHERQAHVRTATILAPCAVMDRLHIPGSATVRSRPSSVHSRLL